MNTFQPVTVNRHSTPEERQIALRQIYHQVLERQPYTYERKHLAKAEKDFLCDKIGVRRFLRELGHSQVYLNSFYHNSSNMKFLELCFKHFLGRAPINQDEIKLYCEILMHKGVAQFITAILDSEEYRKMFGCFTVPYPRVERYYPSPRAYTESSLLNQEHNGQRGRSIPTIYWHQLGLNCDAGVCRHPEADEAIASQISQDDLSQLLQLFRNSPPQEVVATLSREQKEMLRQAMVNSGK
ncbi:MAG: phycobilisome rod-core linker polypeptide [Oscillatoriales cyanobacterium C42_A2020_001]|nr:phycobilisome rod-core linker polypeptide [Leptolyngbyaceae cyanobacterium C42_A2020_001]